MFIQSDLSLHDLFLCVAMCSLCTKLIYHRGKIIHQFIQRAKSLASDLKVNYF